MATENTASRPEGFTTNWEYSPSVSSLFGTFMGVAVFGWLVSVFLSVIHFWALPQIPEGAEVAGSLKVIMSDWGYVLGVPLATLGALYYLATIALAAWWFDTRHPLIIKILTPITATGVIASAYFVWLQLVPIGEICPFCMISAAATVVLFALELMILRASDAPSAKELWQDAGNLWQQSAMKWPMLLLSVGGLTLLVVWAATFAPVPGT
ncbi:vitamin K epoxide reductase family protein [Halorhodospira halochloris]|nr:vitamin K epoxide reductase family protein [Halorhodospira halochloris]MBK1651974.1 vitamin K epoxide reductase [Halorhodospira halochloris]MCG5547928.1 vitamin K epoxide reductase family protein [Halorhodospira halochloris]